MGQRINFLINRRIGELGRPFTFCTKHENADSAPAAIGQATRHKAIDALNTVHRTAFN